MTRYFMKFTPLFAAEVQMMTPPRHQPRRSGRIRSSFRYSADDVRCKDCTRYDSGQPCHLNECVCLEERIERRGGAERSGAGVLRREDVPPAAKTAAR